MRKLSLPCFVLAAALAATPALAHDDHEHGIPGVLHGFSVEHLIGPLAVALAIAIVFSLRKPLARVIARWRARK